MWITPKSADGLETFSRLISMLEYNLRGMKPVGSKDIYEAKALSLISSGDLDIVIALYLPIIGSFAFAIYSSLVSESKNETMKHSEHGPLFAKLQLTSGQFYKGIEALEAVGLIKTYFRNEENVNHFVYGLYAPKDPSSFFQDPLLLGTLRLYLGEEEVLNINQKYKKVPRFDGFEDISIGFTEFFHPDFSDPVYTKNTLTGVAHVPGKIRITFDQSEFVSALGELGLGSINLSRQEIENIEKYASLYCIGGEQMALIVSKCLDIYAPKETRLNYDKLGNCCMMNVKFLGSTALRGKRSQISSETPIAVKTKMMDEYSPIDFLSVLQGNHKPSNADMKLINVLTLEIGLPYPAINALIDFVLQNNNNVLSAAYCEKLAAYLVREGVQTARDAMNALYKTRNRSKTKQDNEIVQEDTSRTKPEDADTIEKKKKVALLMEQLYGDDK